jgi:hypothetical protein
VAYRNQGNSYRASSDDNRIAATAPENENIGVVAGLQRSITIRFYSGSGTAAFFGNCIA